MGAVVVGDPTHNREISSRSAAGPPQRELYRMEVVHALDRVVRPPVGAPALSAVHAGVPK